MALSDGSVAKPDSAGVSQELSLDRELVGRARELADLDAALTSAIRSNEPAVATVLGSAGIGKTRLLSEFLRRAATGPHRARSLRVSVAAQTPAFGPIQKLLRARFSISDGADVAAVDRAVRSVVTDVFGDARASEFLHFLGGFLDLRFPRSELARAVEEDPSDLGRVSRAVLRRFLELDAKREPLILCFDNLQSAPVETLELLEYLADGLSEAPILLVAAARPELLARRPTWLETRPEHHARIELPQLGAEDSASLVRSLLAPVGDVPEELVQVAVETAGGSPYLLTQMVDAYAAAGVVVLSAAGKWEIHLEALDRTSLPLSVEDAVNARIGALTPAERELLEPAAITGSVFWSGALLALRRMGSRTPDLWGGHDTNADHIRDMLARLSERDYILGLPDSSLAGENEFAFKHNLERERILGLIPAERAREWHLFIAEWLEFRLGDRDEEQLELLAKHYELGGAPVRAGRYYIRAADAARARYANARAAEYYAKGLSLIGERDVQLRIAALHHYGDVLQLAGKNDGALAAFREMLDVSFRLDLKAKGGAAHNRIGRLYRSIGHLEDAMRHLGTGHALFESAADRRGVASSLDDVGKVHWMRGNYEAAERFMGQALDLRREIGDLRSIALSLNNLGIVYQERGRFSEALAAFEDALARRREIQDRPGIAQTLNNLGTVHQDAGDHTRAEERYTEALEVAREVGDWMRQAVILTNLGETKYRMKQPAQAVRVLEQAADISATLGDHILEGEVLRGLAKAQMLLGNPVAARESIAASIREFEMARGKPFLGVALRTKGEVYGTEGASTQDHAVARQSFEQSLTIFEELGNAIELAKGREAFADYLSREDRTDAGRRRAEDLRARATEVREPMRASADARSDTDDVEITGRPTHGARG